MKNPYKVLGLPVAATDDEIKSAFRKLAKMTHPDLSKIKKNTNYSFNEIAKAYILLSDPVKREKLDLIIESSDDSNQILKEINIDNIDLQAEEIEYYIHLVHKQVNPYREKADKYIIHGVGFLLFGVLLSIVIYFLLTKNIFVFSAVLAGGILSLISFYRYYIFSLKLAKAEVEIWEKLDF